MKLAKFKRLAEPGMPSYETVSDVLLDQFPHYVRISEYVDVEFPRLKCASEAEEKRKQEIVTLSSEIERLKKRLTDIGGMP